MKAMDGMTGHRPPPAVDLVQRRAEVMRRLVLVLVLFLAFLVWPVQAQDTPTIANLELSLWPEFDRPEMLVIYRGVFASDTPLPLPVELRIPASVGRPTAVAYVGEGGQRFNLEYTTRAEDDWLVVMFQLATLGFQLEYYATLPIDSTGQREFTFAYTADYPVTELSLELQVPPTAEAFELDPVADSVIPESDGLTYHRVEIGPLAQGEMRSWTLTYQKSDSSLTVESLSQEEAAPPAAEQEDNSTVLIFVIAFVALIAVGAGAYWLGRRTQPLPAASSPPSRRQKRRTGRKEALSRRLPSVPTGRTDVLFCHECGTQLRSDSDFCHRCGVQVRRE